ncbi:MAG: PilZ domain-containing protein, partial [Treponema sp.]|nr:PilZ domain-containing protein [Treponema sp.]
VTFTKEIIQVTGLITQQVLIKCVGDFWPCVVYSSSFEGAKVVVNTKSGITEKLQRANNSVSLRLCFRNFETGALVTFFVTARVAGYNAYSGSEGTALFTLVFTQRAPDDLIEIIGRVLDANINSSKRKNERILLTADSMRKLKILSKDTAAFIQGVPRRCILRDISFSGAKIIMMGVAKFLVDRDTALRMDFDDPRESFLVRGKFVRAETVEGRKELIALAIDFEEAVIPMGYKVRLNDFLSVVRADNRPDNTQGQGAPAGGGYPQTDSGTAETPVSAAGTASE